MNTSVFDKILKIIYLGKNIMELNIDGMQRLDEGKSVRGC